MSCPSNDFHCVEHIFLEDQTLFQGYENKIFSVECIGEKWCLI